MRTVFCGGKIVLSDKILENMYLITEDSKILGITDTVSAEYDIKYDLNGKYISPGFVDIHVHGGGGYDFNDGTVEAFCGASKLHLKHGTTSIMPTLVACSDEELKNSFKAYESVLNSIDNLPNFLGLHLEGPYISPKQSGAIDPKYIRVPEKNYYLDILNSCNGISRFTVAPEIPGALEFGDEIKRRGIMASIGHTDAEYADMEKAVAHGYSHITHFYSAMSTIHRKNAYRKLGAIESAYLFDSLSVEIIADGRHLPPELIKLIIKHKGVDNICLITDAIRGAGFPNGTETVLGCLTNGQKVIIENDVAFVMDKSCFAGSVSTADRCIRTLYKDVGVTLNNAVKMMSYNPCRICGIQNKGMIAQGFDADLVVFDENINISMVFVGGNIIN